MRYLAVVLLVAACGGAPIRAPIRATTPSTTPTPARDLASAHRTVPHGAAGTKLETRDPRVVDLDIIRITARPTAPGGEPELTSVASADLFTQANDAAKAGRQREAIAAYRELVTEFPESQFAPASLFNVAAIYDAQGDVTATITTLLELVAGYPGARESVEGHLYIAALQADHQQWAEASATLDAALARSTLTFADRVEAFARKGYVELERGQHGPADAALAAAIAEWRKAPRIDDPYYIAMAHYYRGELLHRKFLAAQVHEGDEEMVRDLATKRGLAAQAYDRWREALAFKHAYWATASGYQMSQIFVELWEAHVKAPYPHRIDASARPRYVTEVHARVRDDLTKALEGHRMNVELAKAYGVETPWSVASAQQAAAIIGLLAQDGAGAYVTPTR